MSTTSKKPPTGGRATREIESFLHRIQQRFHDAKVTPDLAETPRGTSFIDILSDGHHVSVQWKSGLGFGVSSSPEVLYGEGADEVYDSADAAFARVESLILGRKHTSPPPTARIAELRKERGISQQALAKELKVNQAAISRLEHRNDVLLSTIRDVIQSMGGELRLIARFPDGMEKTLEFDAPGQEETHSG